MKTSSELYQLRADLIRGRALPSEDVLELVEELQIYEAGDLPCDACSDLESELEDAQNAIDDVEEPLKARIDDLESALRLIEAGGIKPGDVADFAGQALDGRRKPTPKFTEALKNMEARPR